MKLRLFKMHKVLALWLVLPAMGSAYAECPDVISRLDWGGRVPSQLNYMPREASHVIIHHTRTDHCATYEQCSAIMRDIQDYHMDHNGWRDIGYNFLVGEDGRVYEGRGWMVIGAHATGYNQMGYGVGLIGDFNDVLPHSTALSALQDLIQCGVSEGHIKPDYIINSHRNVRDTACPGQALHNHLTSWQHYNID